MRGPWREAGDGDRQQSAKAWAASRSRQRRRVGAPAVYLRDRGQSDHEELTRGGVPAAWIEWRWDFCWHSACDRVGRLDTGKLSAASRLGASSGGCGP